MKLYETITAKNWVKGRASLRGRRCIALHLSHAYGFRTNVRQEFAKVDEAIKVLFPERIRHAAINVSFNDHPDTTLDDVLRVCKLADV